MTNHPAKDEPANAELGGEHGFACDHPERPPTDRTLFRTNCEPCQIALNVALDTEGLVWFGQHETCHALVLQAATSGKPITIGHRHD